jgi:hypothetical protein
MPIWRNGTGTGLWGTAGNWIADGTGSGVPTAATDAVFDNLSPNCTVNVVGVCRNLNFNSGTGYTNTITMTNNITVGATAATPNHSVILSSGMGVAGTGAILTRANGTTTLTSNGKVWPNALTINSVIIGATSTATLTDNWTVGSLSLSGTGNNFLTLNGAFTITVNGNLFVGMTGGTVSRVATTTGSVSTIKLAGTGTWSTAATFASLATSAIGFGPNLIIDAPGQTVTIANNCFYGGLGVISGVSNFTYVAGTVVHSGTFRLLSAQGGPTYSVNINGSSSTAATTTSTTGVNFNNLDFRNTALGNPQVTSITGGICVVGDTSITSSTTKGNINTTGGTIYANGSLTVNGSMRNPSSTIFRFQGTGTWTENAITIGVLFGGVTWQVQINTAGTITVGSSIGLGENSSLTYTAGNFVWGSGNILYTGTGATLNGLGSYGVQISELNHIGVGPNTSLSFVDTVPVNFTTIRIVNVTSNFSFIHSGTIGWTCNNFYMVMASSGTGNDYRLVSGVEYKINLVLVMLSYTASAISNIILYGTTIVPPKFTLAVGASQDVYYVNGGSSGLPIDSSNGQTIYTRGGAIVSGTLNWKNWEYPRTRHSTFISN